MTLRCPSARMDPAHAAPTARDVTVHGSWRVI
jgi:hypothetical protein